MCFPRSTRLRRSPDSPLQSPIQVRIRLTFRFRASDIPQFSKPRRAIPRRGLFFGVVWFFSCSHLGIGSGCRTSRSSADSVAQLKGTIVGARGATLLRLAPTPILRVARTTPWRPARPPYPRPQSALSLPQNECHLSRHVAEAAWDLHSRIRHHCTGPPWREPFFSMTRLDDRTIWSGIPLLSQQSG